MFYRRCIKRLLDILLSLFVLIVFSPILLILAVLVRIFLGSPVLFTQDRPGYKGKIFKLYKFRTMTDARGADGELLPDEVRLTKFGRLLRASSLDELPEFLNILKGEMSFIGPRPLLVKYLPLYNEHQRRRHDVLPGLTGYAQVNGRNTITWEQKFDYDVWYVDHISFLLDVKILLKTVAVVFRHSDINSANDATMEAFKGTPPEDRA